MKKGLSLIKLEMSVENKIHHPERPQFLNTRKQTIISKRMTNVFIVRAKPLSEVFCTLARWHNDASSVPKRVDCSFEESSEPTTDRCVVCSPRFSFISQLNHGEAYRVRKTRQESRPGI